jgi:hypothetical protein
MLTATACSREVAEVALAHVIGDKVEAACQRGDLVEIRLEFCQTAAPVGAAVIPLKNAKSLFEA